MKYDGLRPFRDGLIERVFQADGVGDANYSFSVGSSAIVTLGQCLDYVSCRASPFPQGINTLFR